jgi:hypothetical protein
MMLASPCCLFLATWLCPQPALVADAPALLQESSEATQEPGDDHTQKHPPEKEKKAFERLTSPNKKKLQAAIRLIEKGDPEEGEIAAGIDQAKELGEAAIPMLLTSVSRLEKVERVEHLWTCLDTLLHDGHLHLAWDLRKKKSPVVLDVYLLRRYSDASRKDSRMFLEEQLALLEKEKDEARKKALRYEIARGLAFRGQADQLDAIDAVIQADWLTRAQELRADFAGINRKPLADKAAEYLQRRPRKEKIASLHLFELFGEKEQARKLLHFLSESDTSIRLAAIDACRVVVDGEPPLNKPSMTEIIERAESWKTRL